MALHMQGTFYGQQQAQDGSASCSFNENRANTMNLTWTTGAAVSLAINNDQYAEGKSCGLCVMYRGRLCLKQTSRKPFLCCPLCCHLRRSFSASCCQAPHSPCAFCKGRNTRANPFPIYINVQLTTSQQQLLMAQHGGTV